MKGYVLIKLKEPICKLQISTLYNILTSKMNSLVLRMVKLLKQSISDKD